MNSDQIKKKTAPTVQAVRKTVENAGNHLETLTGFGVVLALFTAIVAVGFWIFNAMSDWPRRLVGVIMILGFGLAGTHVASETLAKHPKNALKGV